MKYWLQQQARAGNWVDVLGTNEVARAIEHGLYLKHNTDAHETEFRVIERKDTVLENIK